MVRRKISPLKSNTNANHTPNLSSNNNSKKSTTTMVRRKSNIKVFMKDNNRTMLMTRLMYKEMKKLQISTKSIIPKLPFSRLVREIMYTFGARDFRIQLEALGALQEACELYMTQYFEDSYSCTLHAKRVTLQVTDMQLVRKIRGRQDVINH